MLDNVKRAVKHSSIYGLGNISAKLIGIILLPLYTKHITVSDFGIYGFFEIILQLMPIIALGIPVALQRWIGLKEFATKRGSILYSTFIFLLLYLLLILTIIILFAGFFSELVFKTSEYAQVIYIICVVIFFQVLNRIALILIRMEERSVFYGITNTIKIVLHLGVIIYLIVVRQMGFISIFWGELISTVVMFIIIMPYLFKNFEFKLDLYEIREMIKFGLPTLFANYSVKFFSLSERNLLTILATDAALGIYVLGYKVSNIIGNLVINAFNIAFPAIAWPQVGTENEKRFFSKMLTYFAFVIIWMSLVIVVYSEGILHKFAQSRDYWDAYLVIPFISTGLVFQGLNSILNYGLLITKKNKKIPLISGISLAVNIILNLMLIPSLLFIGAAIANMVTYIIRAMLTWFFSVKYYKIKWEIKKIALLLFVAGILYLITGFLDDFSFWTRIGLKGIVIVTFPVWLYLFNFFEAIEIETIKNKFICKPK